MSQATASNSADEFVKGVIPLLQEYKQKLDAFRKQLRQIRRQYDVAKNPKERQFFLKSEFLLVAEQIKRLQPAARSLAQHVSQRIEHAAMDDLARLELRLRLAEFESALQAAEGALAQYGI